MPSTAAKKAAGKRKPEGGETLTDLVENIEAEFKDLLDTPRFNPEAAVRIITITLSKGGVGKTTTAANLAYGLAQQDRKVLLIDTDMQGQCSLILGYKPLVGLYELINPDETSRMPFPDVVHCDPAQPRLHFLAGSLSLNYWDSKVKDKQNEDPTDVLKQFEYVKNALLPVQDDYDYIIFDTAPGIATLGFNVLFYATELLVPFELAPMTTDSIQKFLDTYEKICDRRARFIGGTLKFNYLLPTFNDNTISAREEFEAVRELIEILRASEKHKEALSQLRVLPPIPRTTQIKELPGKGKTIFEHAPTSPAAEAYGSWSRRS